MPSAFRVGHDMKAASTAANLVIALRGPCGRPRSTIPSSSGRATQRCAIHNLSQSSPLRESPDRHPIRITSLRFGTLGRQSRKDRGGHHCSLRFMDVTDHLSHMLTHAGIGFGELNADGDALHWADTSNGLPKRDWGSTGRCFTSLPPASLTRSRSRTNRDRAVAEKEIITNR
jgi:hypothetical protein